MTKAEFDGVRARMYEEAIAEYPLAREHDIQTMQRLLQPQQGERILGLGEGNGYFCKAILKEVGSKGQYMVSDPSVDQLENLVKRVGKSPQLHFFVGGAETMTPENEFDKVWSFGAFHHCPNQTAAMHNIYHTLKDGGRAVICDVFQGSDLAKHFDMQVARYCATGHEVKFLSEEFARTLTYLAGFDDRKVEIVDLPQKWRFESEKDLGKFIYKLHAMTKLPGTDEEKIEQTIQGCRSILGIGCDGSTHVTLNWPMKAVVAVK